MGSIINQRHLVTRQCDAMMNNSRVPSIISRKHGNNETSVRKQVIDAQENDCHSIR